MVVKITKTPIAYWDPTQKKGGRLILYRNESTRSGTSYVRGSDGGTREYDCRRHTHGRRHRNP